MWESAIDPSRGLIREAGGSADFRLLGNPRAGQRDRGEWLLCPVPET